MTIQEALNSKYFKKYEFLYIKILDIGEDILSKEDELIKLLKFLLETFKPTNWSDSYGNVETKEDTFKWIVSNRNIDKEEYLYIINMKSSFVMAFSDHGILKFERGIIIDNINVNMIKELVLNGEIRPSYKPKKRIKRLLENNLHESYPYDSFIVKFNNVNELNEITDSLSSGYNLYLSSHLYYISKNFLEMDNQRSLFLRLYFIQDKLSYEINDFNRLEEYSNVYNWKYDRVYSLNDLRMGVLDRILYTGKSLPTYTPKEKPKRILENFNLPLNIIDKLFQLNFYDTFIFKINEDETDYSTKILKELNIIKTINDFKYDSVFFTKDFIINGNLYSKYKLYECKRDVMIERIRPQINCKIAPIQDSFKDFEKYLKENIFNTNKLYEPKGKRERLLERKYIHKDYPFKTVIIEIKNEYELSYMIKYLKKEFDAHMTDYHEDELKKYLLDDDTIYIRFNYRYNDMDISHGNVSSLEYNIKRRKLNYYKIYTVKDVKNGVIENILNYGKDAPLSNKLYEPKGKIIRENMITNLKDYLLLEKSSLSALGVPREVMQPIQKDLAIPSDAKWDRIRLKKDAISIINDNKKVLLLQIGIDEIMVFISFNNKYFIDTYTMKDSKDWGGGYNKLPRENVSKTQFISRIDSSVILYHLLDDFSIKTQPYRKIEKKEKEFTKFNENFKNDFLEQFNAILRRIVGYNYKDAKDEIAEKAKRVELENKMMISGLENPLEGPNSLTILDQFIIEFEDEYSKYFDERLDLMELSELFTREKIMTSFMLFIYSGKIITT